jgi:hypothetical protein
MDEAEGFDGDYEFEEANGPSCCLFLILIR